MCRSIAARKSLPFQLMLIFVIPIVSSWLDVMVPLISSPFFVEVDVQIDAGMVCVIINMDTIPWILLMIAMIIWPVAG